MTLTLIKPEAHTKTTSGPVPGSILRAAVDVSAMPDEQPYDPQPAAGAGLMEGAVPGIVSVVDVTHPPLQAVQHHLLEKATVGTC